MSDVEQTTQTLIAARNGDGQAAGRLLADVYAELRGVAAGYFRGQRKDHTLQPTALVHEAYLRMIDQTAAAWNDRAHFFRVAAKAMRQILVDHARGRGAAKRGGGWQRVSWEGPDGAFGASRIDLLALDEALERLAEVDPRQASVVELRFFGGLSVDEVARVLDVSTRTIELDWRVAKAWLSRALSEDSET